MRTQPETRARSSQEAGKRALNLGASKANQACIWKFGSVTTASYLALEFGNGFNTFVQQLACCRFCVMQSLAFLLPRQQAEVSWHCSPQPSTFHLFDT